VARRHNQEPSPISSLQDHQPFAGHSPEQERPLGAYALLTGLFTTLAAAFAAWFARSDRQLPDRPDARDLGLVAVATHRASRLLAKERVTSTLRAPVTSFEGDAGPGEVEEAARRRGLRRAIGELVVCPYCLDLWISAALTAGLLVAPRFTRWFAGVLVAAFGADLLQIAYKKAADTL
jgi:Protein of unknown function (DUF1360)